MPGRDLAPHLPPTLWLPGWYANAAHDGTRLPLSELGLSVRGPAAAAGAAAVSAPCVAGAGLRLRLGAALPSGRPPLHGPAVAHIPVSAAQRLSLLAGRRGGPLRPVPPPAYA